MAQNNVYILVNSVYIYIYLLFFSHQLLMVLPIHGIFRLLKGNLSHPVLICDIYDEYFHKAATDRQCVHIRYSECAAIHIQRAVVGLARRYQNPRFSQARLGMICLFDCGLKRNCIIQVSLSLGSEDCHVSSWAQVRLGILLFLSSTRARSNIS